MRKIKPSYIQIPNPKECIDKKTEISINRKKNLQT